MCEYNENEYYDILHNIDEHYVVFNSPNYKFTNFKFITDIFNNTLDLIDLI